PKPAMLGCSTPATGSRQGWLETGRANRSSSRKPIPRSRSVGRAAIASRDQRSFTRIRIPDRAPSFSATVAISSARSLDRKFQIFLASLDVDVPELHGHAPFPPAWDLPAMRRGGTCPAAWQHEQRNSTDIVGFTAFLELARA